MQPETQIVSQREQAAVSARSVLIAEDNPIARKLAVRQMERLGYAVDQAADGREAVNAVRSGHYRAVLMDCEMPEMDGYQATHEIRRLEGDTRHTRIIAITAHEGESERQKCRAAGMDGFITKPIKPEALQKMLEGTPGATDAVPPAAAPSAAAEAAVLAREVIEELRDGDQELLDDLIDAFINKLPGRIAQLAEEFARGDLKAASMNAHGLKGTAANLGALRMRAVCAALDMTARNGAVENVASLLDELRAEYRQASLALAAEHSAPTEHDVA